MVLSHTGLPLFFLLPTSPQSMSNSISIILMILTYYMNNPHNVSLDRTIMSNLQDMLHCHHHGVILYKLAMGITRDMPSELQCKISLHYDPGTNCHCYNLPTMSGEVAVVIPGMSRGMSNSRDIIIYCRQRKYHQRISDLHSFYPTFHFFLRARWVGTTSFYIMCLLLLDPSSNSQEIITSPL